MHNEMKDTAAEVFLPDFEPLPRPAVGMVGQVLARLTMADGAPVPLGAEVLVLLKGRNGFTSCTLTGEGWLATGGGYGFTPDEVVAWQRGEVR
jgi:hypothetical protein